MERCRHVGAAWLLLVAMGAAGCGANPSTEVDAETRAKYFRVTPDDPANPKRIRFDVYGNPYDPAPPGGDEARLPSHERIRLGMRRYADSKLKELGYCPNGFAGPDMVLAPERNRLATFFFVTCLER